MVKVGDVAPAFDAQPLFGLPVTVPPAAGERPMVLCFVRDFASPFARASMAAIQSRYADFDRQGIPLVVLTRTDLTRARDFVPRMHVLARVVVDVDGGIFERYGLQNDRMLTGTLTSLLRPGGLSALGAALGHGQGPWHEGLTLLPASFVIGADGRVAMARYERSITASPDLDALLECALSC